MDTTEARYGEMARLMRKQKLVNTVSLITPVFLWGKPPLFTWMSAIGIELFRLSEFAVRAPYIGWLA